MPFQYRILMCLSFIMYFALFLLTRFLKLFDLDCSELKSLYIWVGAVFIGYWTDFELNFVSCLKEIDEVFLCVCPCLTQLFHQTMLINAIIFSAVCRVGSG